MDDAHKKAVLESINKFSQKQLDDLKPKPAPSRKNDSPEFDLVHVPCVKWMRQQGWLVETYDSKATWSTEQQTWKNQGMKAGTTDSMGVLPNGIALAVEFKAPGKLSTFNLNKNYRQREFVMARINHNAFSCVVDSVERLILIHDEWRRLRIVEGVKASREYLLSMLPEKRSDDEESGGDNEVGF